MSQRCDWLLINARLATLEGDGQSYGEVSDGALAIEGDKIVWIGPKRELPPLKAERHLDCAGAWLTPGLIDCHTHLVYGGDRADEFERRLEGESYSAIAASGGGSRARAC